MKHVNLTKRYGCRKMLSGSCKEERKETRFKRKGLVCCHFSFCINVRFGRLKAKLSLPSSLPNLLQSLQWILRLTSEVILNQSKLQSKLPPTSAPTLALRARSRKQKNRKKLFHGPRRVLNLQRSRSLPLLK